LFLLTFSQGRLIGWNILRQILPPLTQPMAEPVKLKPRQGNWNGFMLKAEGAYGKGNAKLQN